MDSLERGDCERPSRDGAFSIGRFAPAQARRHADRPNLQTLRGTRFRKAAGDQLIAVGLLLFTPEYNHGIPGVFKNAIDWLSRPASDIDRVFCGRPVAI